MPELPEVEVSARIAGSALKDSHIQNLLLKDCKLFRPPQQSTLQSQVDTEHSSFNQEVFWQHGDLSSLLSDALPLAPYTFRHGKLMACLFQAQDARVFCLFARLGMTGKFVRRSVDSALHKSTKLSLSLVKHSADPTTDLRLDFLNTRMFGQIWIQCSRYAVSPDQRVEVLRAIFDSEVKRSNMGLDAYELSSQPISWIKYIREQANHRQVKTALLDQSLLAGIGNIYAAECLFTAKAHPLAKFSQLSDEQLILMAQGLYESMTQTLIRSEGQGEVIYGSGLGPKSPFAVYGREGEPCPTCQAPLAFLRIAGRATVFCKNCQISKI
ncbi:MAG: hypothetical protein CMH49_06810 [Myxococcales bacterium]|nr:hypothetical protein [Myxococcales bacterium]